jgi:hypothetical protein
LSPDGDAFYKFHKIKKNFSEAVDICMAEGAELFRPLSLRDTKTVRELIKEKGDVHVWIGIHDIYSEGHFVTLSGMYRLKSSLFTCSLIELLIQGTPIEDTYSNWHTGEPNNANGSEDCVLLYFEDSTFNDYKCQSRENFICKKNTEGLTQNEQCYTYDKGACMICTSCILNHHHFRIRLQLRSRHLLQNPQKSQNLEGGIRDLQS